MSTLRGSILPGLAAIGLATAGCHDLQPHRLQRLNRGPGLSSDAYYSVPDPAGAANLHEVETDTWPTPDAGTERDRSAGGDKPVGTLSHEFGRDLSTE